MSFFLRWAVEFLHPWLHQRFLWGSVWWSKSFSVSIEREKKIKETKQGRRQIGSSEVLNQAPECIHFRWSAPPILFFKKRVQSFKEVSGTFFLHLVMGLSPRKTLNDEVQTETERLKCPNDKFRNWNCWLVFPQIFLHPSESAFNGRSPWVFYLCFKKKKKKVH